MSLTADRPFQLLDDLPSGRLAIQASAGTGKTFALAALATRFIAERGVTASELLIVTFTRAATAELRSRVRERLVSTAAHLSHDPTGPSDPGDANDPNSSIGPSPMDDELLVHLASQDRELRLARVEQAITEFDAATITTIHGFATQVLGTLGTAAGTDPDATLVDDSAELAAECCADVLSAASTLHPAELLPTFTSLVQCTRNAINIADLVLAPGEGQDGASPKSLLLVELVDRSIALMRLRRRQAGTLSFDDILVELRRALDGAGRQATIETLRTRFTVALIDEFQDTDPVQWDIFSTLFGQADGTAAPVQQAAEGLAGTALVLVGDPKQAIYAFRGANVHTYLKAVDPDAGTERRSLGTNWRSDAAVLDATRILLDGSTYGHDEITFVPVGAAPGHETRRLRRDDGTPFPALSLRLALDPALRRSDRGRHPIYTQDADAAIFADLVVRVRELLDTARIPEPLDGSPDRAVRPSDIAVLVRSATEAEAAQRALKEQDVPAVLARGDSVLESPAAEQWRWLLEALLRPSDPRRASTFALSWFGGRSAEWIHVASDEELGAVQEQLHDWAETLAERGPIDLVGRIRAESGVTARVLTRPDGDRSMTDLDHVAELLQSAAPNGRASVAGLLSVLDAPDPIEVDADIDRDLASRRIESEAQAVQIMTVWVAKGLEFPIVCVPTMWRTRNAETIYQDPSTDERTYDLAKGEGWPDKAGAKERKARARAESAGESLRLLYVALTRAKHHTVVWWSRCSTSDGSSLARVLFARTEGDIDPAKYASPKVALPEDAHALAFLQPLVDRSDGTIAAAMHGRPPAATDRWIDPATSRDLPALAIAHLDRRLDRSPHRWSFTAITNRARTEHADPYDASGGDAGAADEQGPDDGEDAEPKEFLLAPPAPPAPAGSLSRSPDAPGAPDPAAGAPDPAAGLAMLPAGASFGTLVHSVFEEVDFTDPDLDRSLDVQIGHQLSWRDMDLTPVGLDHSTHQDGRRRLVEGLRLAIDTPLGPMLHGVRLRDIAGTDRLDEMSFELRLGRPAGAGVPGRRATDRQIGRLVQRHLTPTDLFHAEPLHDWAGQLADGAFSVDLAGHLTGSIDAVLRVPDSDGVPQFFVVDYKTNRLSEWGQVPGPDDYSPDNMADAMTHHHYPLQALLYSVALHRYLRWRLADYDPATHLGGAAYLFVRGMTGATVPTTDGAPHGVFTWHIPPALVTQLSDLLDGRRVTGLGA